LARVPGVGNVEILGALDYGMRIWLNPKKMTRLGLTVNDVADAIREQNAQVPAGQVGLPPAPVGQQFQYSVKTRGRLQRATEFQNIILRAQPDGSMIRMKDIARVELGSESYNSFGRLNGAPAVLIGVYQLPDANALEVAERVHSTMNQLQERFPEGIVYSTPVDATRFIQVSIQEVVETLFIALVLVFLAVYIFLQDWRATLIPALTIPVALVGTFSIFALMGFSINTFTLFGLVLAIGIVVDDAIVVVEATRRYIDEEGMTAKDAVKKAMSQVTGPVIATTLVLLAMFLPVAFLGGITGQLYRQFALTIAASVCLSTLNALTLSPALCGILLRPGTTSAGPLHWVFSHFNRGLAGLTAGYSAGVQRIFKRTGMAIALTVVLFGSTYALFKMVPAGFVPFEDQGYFFVNIQLPDGASLERTTHVVEKVEYILGSTPGVKDIVALGGLSVINNVYASNVSSFFVVLSPWDERQSPALSLGAILGGLQPQLANIQEAIVVAFPLPPIPGLGNTGGIQFVLQDRSAQDLDALASALQQLITEGTQRPELQNLYASFRADVPQISLKLDPEKTKKLGVSISEVYTALQTYLGSLYVNDFNRFGRSFRVMLQAAPEFRSRPEDIVQFTVRNNNGEMIPLSTVTKLGNASGPESITRYNMSRSAEINGTASPGFSSGQAIQAMEQVANQILPRTMGYEWTGMSYQEIAAGSQAPIVFALAIIFVFLFLAAQYESWTIPFAVVLGVPLAVFGAMGFTWLRGLENGVYAQLGLVMLIGLASKNAILIVEFAKQRHEEGLSVRDAALEAARLRFRPILMTSFSTIFGLLPLVLATGAGAASRHSLGTSVLGGMFTATVFGVLLVPSFYMIVQNLRDGAWRSRKTKRKVLRTPSHSGDGRPKTDKVEEEKSHIPERLSP
ncbi:MAG: efflux RND transporter permease subunit, partial [Nitrospirota bacterium]